MAETESSNSRGTIGMDMEAPYGVYIDGELIAEHESVSDAEAHYQTLRAASMPKQACTKSAVGGRA